MDPVTDKRTGSGCLVRVGLVPRGLVRLCENLGQALAQGHQLGVRVVSREGLDKVVDEGLHRRAQRHVQLQTGAGGSIGRSRWGGKGRRGGARRSALAAEGEPRDIGWVHFRLRACARVVCREVAGRLVEVSVSLEICWAAKEGINTTLGGRAARKECGRSVFNVWVCLG